MTHTKTKFILIRYGVNFTTLFLPWVDTPSTYLEYILRVVYIVVGLSRKKFFWIKKLNGKLILPVLNIERGEIPK